MSQYFENDATIQEKQSLVSFSIHDKEYTLHSNAGVFSKDKLDTGTRILLETVLQLEAPSSSVLDLGCGIGVVGVVMGDAWKCPVTCIDVNERAVALTKQNTQKYNVDATVLCQDGIRDGVFSTILLNPPIRAGKKVIYHLFDDCLEHCDGHIYIVMRKQHGAQSAMRYFQEKKATVERVARDKGFWILKVSL